MRGAQSGVPDGIDFLLAPYRVLDLTDERGLLIIIFKISYVIKEVFYSNCF